MTVEWVTADCNFAVPYQGGQSSLCQLFLFYIKTIKRHQLTEVVGSTHFCVFVKMSFFFVNNNNLAPLALAWGQTSYSLTFSYLCRILELLDPQIQQFKLTYLINNDDGTKLKNLLPDEEIITPWTPGNIIKINSIKEESSVKSSTLFSDFTRLAL
jgi:hypothetical protein